jgi:hypothetical protein
MEVKMRMMVALRFVESVEALFKDDPNWSIFDLDGAKEFYEATGIVPDAQALEVESDG